MASPLTLQQKLQASAHKSLIVGISAAVISVVTSDGLSSVPLMGHNLPKFAVLAGTATVASVAADFAIPMVTPFFSLGDASLQHFENIFMAPLLVGVGVVALDSILSPAAISNGNAAVGGADFGLFKSLAIGGSASVLAGYYSLASGISMEPFIIPFFNVF